MTEAPYPNDTRARGWRFELDYEQIEQSSTWALAPVEIRPWLLMLWFTAWKQTPCGTLPADDEVIAAMIGMPSRLWMRHRKVLMRGWSEASDGRMYHDTMSERVREMLARRRKDADRKAKERAGTTPDKPATPPGVTQESRVTDAGLRRESSTDNRLPTEKTEEEITPPTPRKRGERASAPAWQPPEWVPPKEWQDFEQMRRAMRNVPFTDAARDGVVRELAKFKAMGHDPARLLAHAVTNGHRTVFEPKVNGGFNGSPAGFVSKQQQIETHNRRIGEEWLRKQEEHDAHN